MDIDELIEQVARALCADGPHNPDDIGPNDGPYWQRYISQARISIIATLEGVREPVDGPLNVARQAIALGADTHSFETMAQETIRAYVDILLKELRKEL